MVVVVVVHSHRHGQCYLKKYYERASAKACTEYGRRDAVPEPPSQAASCF